jgi:hypothetical protein
VTLFRLNFCVTFLANVKEMARECRGSLSCRRDENIVTLSFNPFLIPILQNVVTINTITIFIQGILKNES